MKFRDIFLRLSVYSVFAALLFSACQVRKEKQEDERDSVAVAATGESAERYTARSMGLAYLEEGRLEEAESSFRRLIELAPDEALGYANLGLVYLRMGRYEEAEQQLKKAVELDPDNPDIRLNLAKVYQMSQRDKESIDELEKSAELAPDHLQTLYNLAESYAGSTDRSSLLQWEGYMRRIVTSSPSNLVARLHFTEALLRNGKAEEALKSMEELRSMNAEFPPDALDFYQQTLRQLRAGNTDEALTSYLIFHNFLKLTNSYQSGVQELKGGTTSIGYPVITFRESTFGMMADPSEILEAIRFADVTESAGLVTEAVAPGGTSDLKVALATGDFDRDGDFDVFFSAGNNYYLFRNDMGRFRDIRSEAGISHRGAADAAAFADADNDGFLDLYLLREEGNILYRNADEGRFLDIARQSRTADDAGGRAIRFFDADQEGDLDIFIAHRNGNRLLRNNGDGTFNSMADDFGLKGPGRSARDVVMGDFDDDGDVDLLVLNEEAPPTLFLNQRQGRFRTVAPAPGIATTEKANAMAAADYNNDGYTDVFFTGISGSHRFYRNNGDGSFVADPASGAALKAAGNLSGRTAAFLDFDNDGFLDLLLGGDAAQPGGKSLFLFRNDGKGVFEDFSRMLPPLSGNVRAIAIADYNEDGDADIYLGMADGSLRLLRNDGGNANHQLKLQLVGLRTGSAKNNHFGIGARVEVRAGEHYQMRLITEPVMQFGLGQREKADVVRIVWPNGTTQNIFAPGSDEDLVEEQQLKGSCPFLYTWNGREFVFLKDMMWRSALGMPAGIMGGERTYAFPDASFEYLKIPAHMLAPLNGKYPLRVTAELWETIYFDKARLLAVDHPDSLEIFVDERFTGPPFADLRLYAVQEKILPARVCDAGGLDWTAALRAHDFNYAVPFTPGPYQGITEPYELLLEFESLPRPEQGLYLFLQGWIFPTDASINTAMAQSEYLKASPPRLEAQDAGGRWVPVTDNLGFPMGKDKTVVADLRGRLPAGCRALKISSNMQIYWDHAFLASGPTAFPYYIHPLEASYAELQYRGFSEMFRKNGRHGPHWFDYNRVETAPRWQDLAGAYTRYGDVRPLLTVSDSRYVIMNAGDEIRLEFDSRELLPLPPGWTRDFLIHSVGWVKDGDMNTADGQTVEPLPFHGMSRYPYGPEEQYPDSKEYRRYRSEYNTRHIDARPFRRLLAGGD